MIQNAKIMAGCILLSGLLIMVCPIRLCIPINRVNEKSGGGKTKVLSDEESVEKVEKCEKTFKTIDERFQALRKEHVEKFHVPEEDAKFINDAEHEFIKQIDANFRKNVHTFFVKNKP